MWLQKQIQLKAKSRGFHLITEEILAQLPELASIDLGIAHFFLQHTSASIGINENADSSVRRDLESHINVLAPEQAPYYQHTYEGPDDMPAHIKSSLLGCQLSIPIQAGSLQLGTWQGIYLGEHRNQAGPRQLFVTLNGEGRKQFENADLNERKA